MKPSPIGIYARGVAMGAADVVPGVSGGTVALITGIYARLLGALVNIDKQAIVLFFTGRWGALWYRLDGPFLAWLFAGILTAIFSLASAIHWLLLQYPQPLWSFFSGLILISGALLLRSEVSLDRWSRVGFFASGCALAVAISLAPPIPFSASLLGFFIAGTIAICAMILPGISGSFMLVLLGMYGPVLGAVKGLQFAELSVFALGCAVGLITFARILNFLLLRARAAMMAFLSGVLLGSLSSVWPWQITVLVDSMGGRWS
jgi:putative membrane protein